MRSQFFKGMFADCPKIIQQYTEDDFELDEWFSSIRLKVRRGQTIDDQTMRQILEYTLNWSGGSQFWFCLRERLGESFPVLVLVPILMSVLKAYKALSESIKILIQTKKIDTKEKINQERKLIKQRRKELSQAIQVSHNNFRQDIEKNIEILKKSDAHTKVELKKEFEKAIY